MFLALWECGVANDQNSSTLSSWMSSVHRALLDENIDADRLFASANVSLDYVHQQDLRVGVEDARRVWSAAVSATGDDAFGLKVAELLMNHSLDPVNLVVESSRTMGEATERLVKFYTVVSNGVLLYQHKHTSSDIVLAPKADTPLPAKEAVDAAFGLIFKRTESISASSIKPLRIEFMRKAPKNRKAFEGFFSCPLYFDCELNRICYPLHLDDQPLVRSNESLSRVLDDFLDKSVKDVAMPPLTQKVSALVCELLLEESVSLASVAKKMGVGPRTLQRNLKLENAVFKDLLDTCKLNTAKYLLAKNESSITDVAFLLGFSSPSNFVRFFKRFEGVAPGEYKSTGPE